MSNDKKYPFVTKATIAQRLDARESGFVGVCMRVMQARHEARLAGRLARGGWMASQAVVATKLAARFATGSATKSEVERAAALLRRYVKQLASHFREQALRENPSLGEAAARYGVGAPAAPAPPAAAAPALSESEPEPRPAGEGRSEEQAPQSEPEPALRGHDAGESGAGALEQQEDETAAAVLAALGAEPGLRSEEIAARTGITTAMLAPILRAMVDAGTLHKDGLGRGTSYRLR